MQSPRARFRSMPAASENRAHCRDAQEPVPISDPIACPCQSPAVATSTDDHCNLSLDRPQHSGARARDAPVVSAAADGLRGGRHLGPDGYRRDLLRQGLPRPLGGVPCCTGLLGRNTLGAEDAARPPRRPHLAVEVRSGLSGCGTDRCEPADHDRTARVTGCHARGHARRSVVRVERAPRARRLCRAGRGRGRDDRRSGPSCRHRRAAGRRRFPQAHAYDDADARAGGDHRWIGRRCAGERHAVQRRRADVGGRQGRRLHPDLPVCACNTRHFGARRDAWWLAEDAARSYRCVRRDSVGGRRSNWRAGEASGRNRTGGFSGAAWCSWFSR